MGIPVRDEKTGRVVEVWDYDRAIKLFEDSLDIAFKQEVCSLSSIAARMKTYRDIYIYLVEKFEKGPKTPAGPLRTIKKQITTILEARIEEGLMANTIPPAAGLGILKMNHNKTDKYLKHHEECKAIDINGTIDEKIAQVYAMLRNKEIPLESAKIMLTMIKDEADINGSNIKNLVLKIQELKDITKDMSFEVLEGAKAKVK